MIATKVTYQVYFDELEAECLETLRLLNAIKKDHLTADQKEDFLGELSVSISSLRIKTELLEKDLENLDEVIL